MIIHQTYQTCTVVYVVSEWILLIYFCWFYWASHSQEKKERKKHCKRKRENTCCYFEWFFSITPNNKNAAKKNIEIYAIRTYQYTHGFCYPSSLSDNSFFFGNSRFSLPRCTVYHWIIALLLRENPDGFFFW